MRLIPRWRQILVALSCAAVLSASCSPRAAVSRITNNVPTVPGTPWETWRPTAKLPAEFLTALDTAITSTSYGKPNILRAQGRASQEAQSCFPFEKSHQNGHGIDLVVSDFDGDGQVNLLDACLLAADLEAKARTGGLGVYGHETAQGGTFWVHVDNKLKERWGGMRGEGKTPAQPLVWSIKEPSLSTRCSNAKIAARNLRVIVEKQPSLLSFDREEQTLRVHPAVLVYAGKRLIKAYPAALGLDPIEDKQKRDDYRTPEGEFYLCERNPNSRFFRSLRLSYPNAEDAARGLRQGLIDRRTHNRIVGAIRRRVTPPQDTRLGSDIMLHGGGIGHNWTWGCVALEDKNIEELFKFLKIGTQITVRAPRR